MAEMPSASSMFSAYASLSTTVMLFRSAFYELVPEPIRKHLLTALLYILNRPSSQKLRITIEEDDGMTRNEVYDAAEVYLSTKIGPNNDHLRISKAPQEKALTIQFQNGEEIVDHYDGVSLHWYFVSVAESSSSSSSSLHGGGESQRWGTVRRYFELRFDKKHKEVVLSSYLPFVLDSSKAIKDSEKALKLFTLSGSYMYGGGSMWESVNLEHPATFDKLAMDPAQKKAVMDDLDRFVRRKEFYKRVGRAWKRGYLLYGPPGTGKSSLVAAIANYLRFDIYDLQLANIMRDRDLRKMLLATSNRSILVIEDIDCSVELPERRDLPVEGRKQADVQQLTLSGLLNFIDGLWSSCGDERIIIFTTNHKEKIDQALLRPGRMDLHVHMSYCTPDGFRLLAANYLGVTAADRAQLFDEIDSLMATAQATPAEVAEELMKCDDADAALGEVVKLLKRKRVVGTDAKGEDEAIEDEGHNHKKAKEEQGTGGNEEWENKVCEGT